MYFSYDLEATFTEDEKKADQVLHRLRRELKNDTYDATVHNYFDNFVSATMINKANRNW